MIGPTNRMESQYSFDKIFKYLHGEYYSYLNISSFPQNIPNNFLLPLRRWNNKIAGGGGEVEISSYIFVDKK